MLVVIFWDFLKKRTARLTISKFRPSITRNFGSKYLNFDPIPPWFWGPSGMVLGFLKGVFRCVLPQRMPHGARGDPTANSCKSEFIS